MSMLPLLNCTALSNCTFYSGQYNTCIQEYENLTLLYNNLETVYNACSCSNLSIICARTLDTKYDLGLHIAAVFIILVASFLGASVPIVSKAIAPSHLVDLCVLFGKCAGIGVVLACGFVHMLQPSAQSLTSPCVPSAFNNDYNAYAYLFAMISGLVMQFFDFILLQYFRFREKGKRKNNSQNGVQKGVSDHERKCDGGDCEEGKDELDITIPSNKQEDSDEPLLEIHEIPWDTKKLIEAYVIEFAVSTHSLFVGFAVGVVGLPELQVLIIALVFHQFFEGIALGGRVVDANFNRWNEILLVLIFSFAAPIGLSIGSGVSSTLNTNGELFLLVQGTFDGFCGGLLIFVGYSLLLVDFPRDMEKYCQGKFKYYIMCAMFFFLWIGAGLMAFIGRYL